MSPDKQIADILAKYGEDFAANTWIVPGGRSRAVNHACIERIIARAGIWFDPPTVIRSELENVALVVVGHMGAENDDREEWSFGEASPKNNKNAYPFAMAEKRAKDRVALKLLRLHGLIYSEEEADEFKPQAESVDAASAPDISPPRQRLSPPSQQATSQEAVTTGKAIDMGDGVLTPAAVIARRLENLKKRVASYQAADKIEDLIHSPAAEETLNAVDVDEAMAVRTLAFKRIRELRGEKST